MASALIVVRRLLMVRHTVSAVILRWSVKLATIVLVMGVADDPR
jgi:hypothetical protein